MFGAFFVQFKRELGSMLQSSIAYVLFTCMAFLAGINFFVIGEAVQQGLKNITVIQLFYLTPIFWFAVIILVPVMTMRLLSEEYKTGSIEMLMTAPIREWEVILAKFFGAFVFYMFLWVSPLLSLACFQILTNHEIPVGWIPLGLSYLMLSLISMFWISIGLFTSSLTKNQVIAGFTSFTIIAILFFYSLFNYNFTNTNEWIGYMHSLMHMETFTRGTLDTRPVVFYLSGTAMFLFFTRQVLHVRKLKS